jgi:fructokinase
VIVVGGEALVDLVDDHGVRRPVPGGGPFNTAVALGRLGVPVAYLGTLSRDDHGTLLARVLIEAGVDVSLIRRSDAATPVAVVDRQHDGGNTYAFQLAGTSFTDLPPEAIPPLPGDVWAIHVGTLALAVDPPAAAYEALLAREAGFRKIVLDPNVRPAVFGDRTTYRARFERLTRLADIVKLSDDDAAWVYPDLELDGILDRILGLGPRLVAITLGRFGAVAASPDARVRVPGARIIVADTVGAGDSFGAALLAALAEQGALESQATPRLDNSLLEGALTFAVTASAITCTRAGAVPPSRAEIDAWIGSSQKV